MSIIVSAWTHKAKVYPYWVELVQLLEKNGHKVIQVAKKGEEPICADCRYDLPMRELERLTLDVGDFLAVDNFFHHLAHYLCVKGAVIYGPSDPDIFGYSDQINVLKSREYLRKDQFGFYRDWTWEHEKEGWYEAEKVYDLIFN